MSDFDKEAEREKLREKYERDKRDREATQRMSDLLLKGATMTNTHCDTCGDPLFRQQGTTFCPTCHGGPDGVDASVPADEDSSEATDPAASDDRSTTPARTGDDASADTSTPAGGDSSSHAHTGTTRPEPEAPSTATDDVSEAQSPTHVGNAPGIDSPVDGDFEASTQALLTALERFSTAAADTADPRYAKECLEAAHEAAATLRTLDR